MSPRPSTVAIAVVGTLAVAFVACFADAQLMVERTAMDLAQTRALATRLDLVDLALFTEARYTRHPVQADLHSAFQDHPLALEHFPSGSLLPPHYEPLVRETTTPD